jgi:hypothetical protein
MPTAFDVLARLVIEESRHEAAEEMYFWPVVRERLGDETTVWPGLRDALSAAEADDLGRKLEQGKETAGQNG